MTTEQCKDQITTIRVNRNTNEVQKDFTIKLSCNEAVYRALMLMLGYCMHLGNLEMSRSVAMLFNGDGQDKIDSLEFSVGQPGESDKGIMPNGSFWIDTDQVYDGF